MGIAIPFIRGSIGPTSRGKMLGSSQGAIGVQRWPSDPQGTTALTLTNLVVGSAIRIEVTSTGALVTSRTAASTSEVFSGLYYYASGSANNDIRIKVRKGSAAPKYQPYETQTTMGAAPQFIYIAQVPDPIA